MQISEALDNVCGQMKMEFRLKGGLLWRLLYWQVYYLAWFTLRWGDRHQRALNLLRILGLTKKQVCVTTPEGLHFTIDLFTEQCILNPLYREHPYTPTPDFEVRKGYTVLDVGAHQGTFACQAAQRAGPNGRIFAFEPVPSNQKLFRCNARQNGLSTIELWEGAVSDTNGSCNFYLAPYSGNHSMESGSAGHMIRVPCICLDSWMNEKQPERVDLLKIDVEGAEDRVIRGAENLLKRFRPRIVAEVDNNQTASQMRKMLNAIGYETLGTDRYLYASYSQAKNAS